MSLILFTLTAEREGQLQRTDWQKMTKIESDLPFVDSLYRCPQQLRLGKVWKLETQKSTWVSDMGNKYSSAWVLPADSQDACEQEVAIKSTAEGIQ